MSKKHRLSKAKQTNDDIPALLDVGYTGFKRFGGIVSEEFHTDLKGTKAARVYREMGDNDPLLGGALRGMRMLIRQAPWPVMPANESSEAHYWGDKLDECMYDMETPWRQTVDDMFTVGQYGFCLLWEKNKIRRGDNPSALFNSQYNDGLYGWRSLEIRKQDTIEGWKYSEDGKTLLGCYQRSPPNYKRTYLPLSRMAHLRFEPAGGSPEGRSGLRNAYRPYYLKTMKEEIEGTGIARDLAGYPVMEVPVAILGPGATADEVAIRNLMFNIVRKVKRDQLEGLVIPCEIGPDGEPTGYKFRLMSSGGSRAIDIDKSITRDRVDELISLLWEFALLGAMENGSRSLSSDKTQLASVALGGMMDIMTETLNISTIARWCILNKIPRHLWPTLSHGDVEKENITEWITGFAAAATGGLIVPTASDESKIREKLGLEQRGDDDDLLPSGGDDVFGDGPLGPTVETPETVVPPVPEPPIEDPIDDSLLDDDGFPSVMDAEEAARWLKVPKSTIMRAIRNGKLPGVKVGMNYKILRRDLETCMGLTS